MILGCFCFDAAPRTRYFFLMIGNYSNRRSPWANTEIGRPLTVRFDANQASVQTCEVSSSSPCTRGLAST
jgi:hypothetical protein